MSGLHFPITGDNKGFITAINGVKREIEQTSNIVKQNGGDIDRIINKLGTGLASLGAAFSAQQLVSQVVKVRGEFQQLEVAFTTMLGSAEKADSLLSQLTKTAAVTPFGLQDVASGAKQLLAYGIQAENVNDTLLRLGDIAAGLSIPLGDLVYLYGTTMTQGRMFTMDLRQFMGRGIPIAEELAKIFGVAKDEVAGLVTDGKVTSDVFAQAIENMTNTGSKFGGLMVAQSKTITGQISNIQDAIDVMFNEIGQSSEGVINTALDGVSFLVDNYEKVGEAIAVVITAYGAEKAAIAIGNAIKARESALMKQIAVEKALATKAGLVYTEAQIAEAARTKLNTIAQQGLVKSLKAVASATLLNPYVAIGAAVAAMGFAIYKAATYQSDYEKSQKKLNEAFKESQIEITKEITQLERLKGQLRGLKEGTKEYNDVKSDLVSFANKYDAQLANEIEKVGLTEQAYKKLSLAVNDSINARIKSKRQSEIDTEYSIDYEKYINKLSKQFEKSFGVEQGAAQFQRFKTLFSNRQDLAIMRITATRNGKRAMRNELGTLGETEKIDPILEQWRKALYSTGDYKEFTEIIGELIDARNRFYKDSEDLERKFGEQTKKSTKSGGKEPEKVQNKSYWEELKKKSEEELASLSVAELNTGKALDIRKKIAEYDAKIALYDTVDSEKKDKLKEKQKNILSNLQAEDIESETALLEDGYRKNIQVIEDSYNEAVRVIEKKADELRQINKELGLGEILTDEQQQAINKSKRTAGQTRAKAVEDELKTLLDKYKSFNQERIDLEERYSKDVEVLQIELTKRLNSGVDTRKIEDALDEVDKKYKESVDELNKRVISSSKAYEKLFGDISDMTQKQINEAIASLELLLDYLNTGNGKKTLLDLGFDEEFLKALKNSPEEVKEIEKALRGLKEGGLQNPFKGLKEFFNIGPKAKVVDLNKALSDMGNICSSISGISHQLADTFEALGNTDMSNLLNDIGDAVSGIGNVVSGFANGGFFGAAVAVVGNTLSMIENEAREALEREQEFYQKFSDDVNKSLDLKLDLLRREREALEEGTIFGTVDYATFKNSISQALKYQEELGKRGVDIKKYKVQTGLVQHANWFEQFFLGRSEKEAIYDKLLDLYPGLFDEDGNLNLEYAKKVNVVKDYGENNSNALTQARLEKYIAYAEQVENAWGNVESYLSGIFGNLGDSLTDALVGAFRSGEDAAKKMSDSAGDMIEQLAEDMLLSQLFAGLAEDYQEKVFGIIKNTGLSEEQILEQIIEESSNFINDALDYQEKGELIMQSLKDKAAEKGIELWGDNNGYDDSASRKAFEGMSQETASELNGRFTALQVSGEEIKNQMFNVVFGIDSMIALKTAGNTLLSDIREQHALTNIYLEDITSYVKTIKTNTSYLQSIDNNLKS